MLGVRIKEKNFYIMNLVQKEEKLFGLEFLEGYLLYEEHTYIREMLQEKSVFEMEGKEKSFGVWVVIV